MLVGVNGGLLDGFTELLEYCLTQVFRRLLHVFLPLLSVITVCTCMMYLKFNGEHVVRKRPWLKGCLVPLSQSDGGPITIWLLTFPASQEVRPLGYVRCLLLETYSVFSLILNTKVKRNSQTSGAILFSVEFQES